MQGYYNIICYGPPAMICYLLMVRRQCEAHGCEGGATMVRMIALTGTVLAKEE